MLEFIVKLSIVFVLLLNSSCIHTTSTESHFVSIKDSDKAPRNVSSINSVILEQIVYQPEQLPLEVFFRRLQGGEFVDAFKKINFNYKQSNTDNQMIREMLSDGLVPAYVRVKNTSEHPLMIKSTQFVLKVSDGKTESPALDASEIPYQFSRFNPSAFAANVYNIGVVVIVTVAIILILASASNGGHMPSNFFPSESRHSHSDSEVLNPIQKTTKLKYEDYLLNRIVLAPGAEIQGLLFFRLKPDLQNIPSQIEFRPGPAKPY